MARSGRPDSTPLVVGTGTNPAVAAGQSGYLLTWIDGENLRRRWLQADGTLGPLLPPVDIDASKTNPAITRLVFDGDRFVFGWHDANRVRALRLDSSGAPLDAAPLNIAIGVDRFDVTADTTPAANRRTFAFSYRYVFGDDKARLLRSQSGVLVEPELILGTPAQLDQSLSAAASDGTKIVMSFFPKSGSTIARGFLDPVAISFEPSTFKDTGNAMTGKLWFDGNSYLLLESNTSAGSLGVRRFHPTLAPVDSPKAGSGYVLESAYPPYAFWHVAAASNKAGTSLVAYPQLDTARLGGSIKLRLINNDGLKDPDASGGAGGAGAGGEDGGVAGSVGTGGTNAGTGGASAGTGGASAGTGGTNAGTGGTSAGTGGTSAGTGGGDSGGGVSAGGDATSEGGTPQSGGTEGQAGTQPSAGSSSGGNGQGGDDAQSGAPSTGGKPAGTSGAAQGGASAGRPQAGSSGSDSIAGTNDPSTSDGCGCRVVAPSNHGVHWSGTALALFGLTLARIRKRRRAREFPQSAT
jgi:hypothetical protein